MDISYHYWTSLRPMDRIIVEHNGERRVAQVDSWALDGRLRVRLHKKQRLGFCCGTLCVKRAQVVHIARCKSLGINRGSTTTAIVLACGAA